MSEERVVSKGSGANLTYIKFKAAGNFGSALVGGGAMLNTSRHRKNYAKKQFFETDLNW